MNWKIIFLLFIVLFIISIIGTMLIFYIRHWANRQLQQNNESSEIEGTYFKRYLPPLMLKQYSHKQQEVNSKRKKSKKLHQLVLSTLTIGIILSLFTSVIYANKHKLSKPIEIEQQEIDNISMQSHKWEVASQQNLPKLNDYLENLQIHGITILKGQDNSESTNENGIQFTAIAENQWKTFSEQYNIPLYECNWETLDECLSLNTLFLALPSAWDTEKTNKLLSNGKKIIFYGFPKQVLTTSTGEFHFEGLKFSRNISHEKQLAIVSDRELTLGFDAGLIFNLAPTFTSVVTKSKKPQAISISDRRHAGGAINTRLYSQTASGGGKFVWMDFSPNKSDHEVTINHKHFDALLAGIFRYLDLDNRPYSSIATWPSGLKFAALMEEDTEDQYRNAKRVAEYFQQKKYPITWFILSNDAQEHQDVTQLLAETGEIACHGDHHQPFALNSHEQQHIRLARCKKALQAMTGHEVLSFRPPEEKHNESTLSALANTGYKYFIAKTSTDRFVPQIYTNLDKTHQLVSIPRMNSDDYTIWHNYQMDSKATISQLYTEMDWIESIGGLFLFSFHTQFMNKNEHFKAVTQVADRIAERPAFFATTREIAEWWTIRKQLLAQQNITQMQMDQYKPVLLAVDENGHMTRSELRQNTLVE